MYMYSGSVGVERRQGGSFNLSMYRGSGGVGREGNGMENIDKLCCVMYFSQYAYIFLLNF